MTRKTITRRANAASKRYGKTTNGTAKQVKPKVTVRPTGGKRKVGVKVKAKF